MPLLLLIRHGENEFVKTGKLPGHLSGIHLNEKGQKQAQALGEALKNVPIKAIYASPLERAVETAEPIAKARQLTIQQMPELMDSDVGTWQGKSLKVLRRTKAWQRGAKCSLPLSVSWRRILHRPADAHRRRAGRHR